MGKFVREQVFPKKGFFPVVVVILFGRTELCAALLLCVPGVSGTEWQNSQACRHAGISGSPVPPSQWLTAAISAHFVNVFRSSVAGRFFFCAGNVYAN